VTFRVTRRAPRAAHGGSHFAGRHPLSPLPEPERLEERTFEASPSADALAPLRVRVVTLRGDPSPKLLDG
jgi:hypothetical protein